MAVLLLAGCGSSGSTSSGKSAADLNLVEPEVQITQLNEVAQAARYQRGPISVHYQVRVANRSSEPITLDRIDVQSVGYGSYSLAPNPATIAMNLQVQPDHYEVTDFWTSARVDIPSMTGANGPVSVRATAHFDSPAGKFQTISVQQINDPVRGGAQ
jgi:hypothetical protein